MLGRKQFPDTVGEFEFDAECRSIFGKRFQGAAAASPPIVQSTNFTCKIEDIGNRTGNYYFGVAQDDAALFGPALYATSMSLLKEVIFNVFWASVKFTFSLV